MACIEAEYDHYKSKVPGFTEKRQLAAKIAEMIGNHAQIKASTHTHPRSNCRPPLASYAKIEVEQQSTYFMMAVAIGLDKLVERWLQSAEDVGFLLEPEGCVSAFDVARHMKGSHHVKYGEDQGFEQIVQTICLHKDFDFTKRIDRNSTRFLWACKEGRTDLIRTWLADPRMSRELVDVLPENGTEHAFAAMCEGVEERWGSYCATIARLIAESPYGTPALIGGGVSNLVWAWRAGLRDICSWLTHEDCGDEKVNSGLDGQLFYSSCKAVWETEYYNNKELPAKVSFAEGLARHVRPDTPGPNGGTNLLWARLAGLKIAQAWEYDSAWSRGYVAPLPAKATTDAETTPFPMLCGVVRSSDNEVSPGRRMPEQQQLCVRARKLAIAVAASPHCKPMQVDSKGTSNVLHAVGPG